MGSLPKTRYMSEIAGTVEYNHRAFMSSAECYGIAAFRLAQGPLLAHLVPVGTLACHCMELALKAVLLSRGAGPEDLKRHGHDLRRLLAATQLPWPDLDPDSVPSSPMRCASTRSVTST